MAVDYTNEYLHDAFKRTESDFGVDRNKYYNEILYDIKVDRTYSVNSVTNLIELIEKIRNEQGIKKIKLCDLELHHGKKEYALNFEKLENIVFEGGNITVCDFTPGIAFRNCKNIYFRDINFTYDVPMYVSGKVLGSTKNSVTVHLYDNYTTDVFLRDKENNQTIYNSLFEKELIAEYLEYEEGTNIPRENGNFKYNNYNEGSVGPKLAIKGHSILDKNTVRIDFGDEINCPPLNTTVSLTFTMYQCPGILFKECENVYLENFEINQVPGMAANFTTCKDININRIKIRSNVEGNQYLTLTADGLHIKNCKGKVKINNSLLEGSHDDALNIAGMYLEVFKVSEGKAYVRAHLGMWATHVPLVGDTLEVRSREALALKEKIQLLAVDVHDDYVVIKFDGKCKLEKGDFLADLNNVASMDFVNNIVRNKRNRGLLLQTRDVLVKDNYFSHVVHGAILMVCEVNNFCESISVKNILIEKNKFYRCNEYTNADIEITASIDENRTPELPVMENITIRENLLAESGNCCVYVNSGKSITISDNIMFRPGRSPLADINKNTVVVLHSRDVMLNNNKYVFREGEGINRLKVEDSVHVKDVLRR